MTKAEWFKFLDATSEYQSEEEEWQHSLTLIHNEIERLSQEQQDNHTTQQLLQKAFPAQIHQTIAKSTNFLQGFKELTPTTQQLQDTISKDSKQILQLAKVLQPYTIKLINAENKRQYLETAIRIEKLCAQAKQAIETVGTDSLASFLALSQAYEQLPSHYTQLRRVVHERMEYLSSALKNQGQKQVKKALEELKYPTPLTETNSDDQQLALQRLHEAFLQLLRVQVGLLRREQLEMTDEQPFWAIQCLTQPLITRLKYHFAGSKRTSRIDKPEWLFNFVLTSLRSHAEFLQTYIQPILDEAEIGGCDVQSRLLRGLIQSVNPILVKVLSEISSMKEQDNSDGLFCHVLDEILTFEKAIDHEFGYCMWSSTEESQEHWPRCLHVVSPYMEKWIAVDLKYALSRVDEAIQLPASWSLLYSRDEMPKSGDSLYDFTATDELKPTESAHAVASILQTLKERFETLPRATDRLRFVSNVQKPIIQKYGLEAANVAKRQRMRECINTVDYDISEEEANLRWRNYCGAINSCQYLACLLTEWSETIFFLELQHESAKVGIFANTYTAVQKNLVSALTSVEDSRKQISKVIKTVAKSEEAAKVSRAILGPSAVIGPGAAFSAAFSSVRHVVRPFTSAAAEHSQQEKASVGLLDEVDDNADIASTEDEEEKEKEEEAITSKVIEKCIQDVAKGIMGGGTNEADDANDSLFNREIKMLSSFVDAMVGDATDAMLLLFKDTTRHYRLRKWDALSDAHETLSVSTDMGLAVSRLLAQLNTAQNFLEGNTFQQFWKIIAAEIDAYLFKMLILQQTFNARGRQQLAYDVNYLITEFMVITPRAKRFFAKTRESCTLLTMPMDKVTELYLSLDGLDASQQSEQLVSLLEICEIFTLDPVQALQVLAQHLELQQQQ